MAPSGSDSGSVGDSMRLLADETRVRIIRALVEAGDDVGIHGLPYAELKERSGVEDNGRFNYHLGKLVDRFVVKDEETGRYHLRFAAHHLYRTLLGGAFSEETRIGRYGIDSTCPYCGTGLEAHYTANQIFYVRCFGCETALQAAYFPARGISSWSAERLPAVVDRHIRESTRLMGNRICPWCGTRLTVGVVRDPDHFDFCGDHPDSPAVFVTHVCGTCGGYQYNTVGMVVLDRTPVASFFHDHGVDIGERRTWDLEFAVTGRHTTVRSEDPWRIDLSIPCDDERLRLTVDGDGEIVESDRSSA